MNSRLIRNRAVKPQINDKTNEMNITGSIETNNQKQNPKNQARPIIKTSPPDGSESFLPIFSVDKVITVNDKEYIILESIFSGKGTEILKVMDETGEFYALKRIKYGPKDNMTRDNYMNEVQFLKELGECDRIIQMYDSEINTNERTIYIVLELGDIDLGKVISKQGFVQPNYLRHTWQQMLEAVQVLHMNRIIHGHLKPSNFLYVKGTLKLIDFGIAKVIDEDATSTIFENTESFKYQAPEAVLSIPGHGAKMSCASDVWSLGCILFELIYNRSLTPIEITKMADRCNLKFASIEGRPDMDLLVDVMRECLHKNPKNRPSIEDLLSHPYVSCASVFFLDRGLSIKENILGLVKQVQNEYSDSEFNCPQGKLVIHNLSRQLLSGRQMRINAR